MMKKDVLCAHIEQLVSFDSENTKAKYIQQWKRKSFGRLIIEEEYEADGRFVVLVKKPYNQTPMYLGEVINSVS